ncbi:MAG TPA: glycosyltransferase [Microbacteriaceae bacterium]|nr:glycosyltransferase [Microbacteriaceae bacterium]
MPNATIIAMTRVRNEGDVMTDSLDALAQFADGIVVFDDCSTDDTVDQALAHPSVVAVVRNRRWRRRLRIWEETAHRSLLYRIARRYRPEWVFYADADERTVGDVRTTLLAQPAEIDAMRVQLFDAYMTPEDHAPFRRGDQLLNFRSSFGPERRNILVAWRTSSPAAFRLPDAREPQGIDERRIAIGLPCQHFGKAMSVEQWEQTCRYYIDNFPELYQERWRARIGKALHTVSDFDRPLVAWDEVLSKAVDLS